MSNAGELGAELEALSSIIEPLPLDVAAAVLERPLSEVAAVADELAEEGRVAVDRSGVSGGSSTLSQGRFTVLATRLAEELEGRGAPARQRGTALWHAGAAGRAYPLLRESLTVENLRPDERHQLVELVIESGREARVAPEELSGFLIERARFRRNRGESEAALADLEAATPALGGESLVDALAFAAAIQDDLQRPSDAERQVAMAMLIAADQGFIAKLGSLSTFHGRVLSRLGFEREADDAFSRGLELVSLHGTEIQRFYASINRAWTDLDRGWMERADNGFTTARERAATIEDEISVADKDIYMARARFGAGDATGAQEALARAQATADRSGAAALHFLIAIAQTEGAIAFHRPEDAIAASDRLDEIVAQSFPGWANRAATLRARALLVAGDRAGARAAIEAGVAATPPGANGLRLRAELDALSLAAADTWNAERAADVADRLVQAGWLGTAAWLLVERCRREKNAELGRIAAGLAHRIGNPMLAAEAIEAADAWSSREAGPVALAVARVGRNVPEEWEHDWRLLPFVEHALAAIPSEEAEVTDTDLLAGLDAALAAAGLGGAEAILSPSQRRAAGLVVAPSRVASIFRWVGPLVGAAVVAAVIGFVFIPEQQPLPTTTTVAPTTTTTTAPPPEDTKLETPDELTAQVPFAGGESRNAAFAVTLGEDAPGYYWRAEPTGFVRADAIARGKALYLGTSEGFVAGLDIVNDGKAVFEDSIGAAIASSFTSDSVTFGQDSTPRTFVFYGDDSGVVHMRNVDDRRGEVWAESVGAPLTGPPLVRDSSVIVATTDGRVLRLQGDNGAVLEQYPADSAVESGFAQPMAAADGVIYLVTGEGAVILVDEETFSEICVVDRVEAVTMPVVAEDRWFIGTTSFSVWAYRAGSCSSPDGPAAYQIDTPIRFAPVVADGVIWNVADEIILPINVDDGQTTITPFDVGGAITSPLVVAGDQLLMGVTRGGQNLIVAVSLADGSEIWSFGLDGTLRTRPVVGDGFVIAATERQIVAVAVPTG